MKERKFKAGDKVKVTVSSNDSWYGQFKEYEGTVSHVNEDGTVYVDNKYFLQIAPRDTKTSKIVKIEEKE